MGRYFDGVQLCVNDEHGVFVLFLRQKNQALGVFQIVIIDNMSCTDARFAQACTQPLCDGAPIQYADKFGFMAE